VGIDIDLDEVGPRSYFIVLAQRETVSRTRRRFKTGSLAQRRMKPVRGDDQPGTDRSIGGVDDRAVSLHFDRVHHASVV